MSYTIIYNKQFIKVSNTTFVPMVLCGSNNCYDNLPNGRMRRERSFTSFRYILNGKLIGSLEEMLNKCDSERNGYIEANNKTLAERPDWDVYDDKHFGYFSSLAINSASTRKTTYGMYKAVFVNGCKNAKTIEELRELNIGVKVHNGWVSNEEIEKIGKERKSIYPNTTEELINAINELEAYYEGTDIGVYVGFTNSCDNVLDKIKWANRGTKVKRAKVKKVVSEYYVFEFEDGYFSKGVKYGFKFSRSADSGLNKRAYTEKQANRVCEQLNAKHHKEFKVKKIILNNPIEIFV